jgi:hypothetical protein
MQQCCMLSSMRYDTTPISGLRDSRGMMINDTLSVWLQAEAGSASVQPISWSNTVYRTVGGRLLF